MLANLLVFLVGIAFVLRHLTYAFLRDARAIRHLQSTLPQA